MLLLHCRCFTCFLVLGSYVDGLACSTWSCPDPGTASCGPNAGSPCNCKSGYYTSTCAICEGRTLFCTGGARNAVASGYFTTGCQANGQGCTGQSPCPSRVSYCSSGMQYIVDVGCYSTGCQPNSQGCTGQSACNSLQYYCANGIQNPVAVGYYVINCQGTSYCTGQSPCSSQQYFCVSGVQSQVAAGYYATECQGSSLCTGQFACSSIQYYCASGVQSQVTAGYYSTGCQGSYYCTGQSPCSSQQNYCSSGVQYSVNNGFYSTGCQSDGTACTGQSPCGSQQFYCASGIQYTVSAGYYSRPAGSYATTQTKCEVGFMCQSGVSTACSIGSFQDQTGATTCKQCSNCATGLNLLLACSTTADTFCKDKTSPTLSLSGCLNCIQEAGFPFLEPGYSVFDTYDHNPTVTISGVDITRLGLQSITYQAIDQSGNKSPMQTRKVTIVDRRAPNITLKGSTNTEIDIGAAYLDTGAMAVDTVEGDLSFRIKVTGVVDTSRLGMNVLYFDVMDTSGNSAIQQTRVVYVKDLSPPILTSSFNIQSTLIEVAVPCPVSFFQVTALDFVDGNVSSTVEGSLDNTSWNKTLVFFPVNASSIVSVYFSAVDKAGNVATPLILLVSTHDTTPPSISLLGGSEMQHEGATVFVDPGAKSVDLFVGDITGSILVTITVPPEKNSSMLKPAQLSDISSNLFPVVGSIFTLNYTSSDTSGNVAFITRTVRIIDTTPPVLMLKGLPSVTIEASTPYNDEGATVFDSLEKDSPIVKNAVYFLGSAGQPHPVSQIYAIGTYNIVFYCSDSSGNAAMNVTRTATVIDTVPPMIAVQGFNSTFLNVGSPYLDAGAIAFDSYDGNLTSSIVITSIRSKSPTDQVIIPQVGLGAINSKLPKGTNFTVLYSSTDSSGNEVNASRTVTLIDNEPPHLELLGGSVIYIPLNATFSDPWISLFDNSDTNSTLLFSMLTIETNLNISASGSYYISYLAVDSSGNSVSRNRTVIVGWQPSSSISAGILVPAVLLPCLLIILVMVFIIARRRRRPATAPIVNHKSNEKQESSEIIKPSPAPISIQSQSIYMYDTSDFDLDAQNRRSSVRDRSGWMHTLAKVPCLDSTYVEHSKEMDLTGTQWTENYECKDQSQFQTLRNSTIGYDWFVTRMGTTLERKQTLRLHDDAWMGELQNQPRYDTMVPDNHYVNQDTSNESSM